MKSQILKSFIVIFIAMCSFAYTNTFTPYSKTYVNPKQIIFLDNAIWIQMNDYIFQTDSIHIDTQGLYFQTIKYSDCGALQWLCTKEIAPGSPCNTCNPDWYGRCSTCGKWR